MRSRTMRKALLNNKSTGEVMRTRVKVTLTSGMVLLAQAAYADSITDAYASAAVNEKLVICAPVLVKQGGMLELSAARLSDRGETSKAEEHRKAALNIRVRGQTLEMIGRTSNPKLLDKAWKLSADNVSQATYSEMTSSCVALYNDQRREGKIPMDVENQAVERVRRETAARSKKADIDPGCRSKGSSPVDLCVQARAYADETAKTLPMRLNQNLTIVTAAAAGKRIIMTAVLAYDRQYLESVAESKGASMQSIDAAMSNTAKAGVCAQSQAKAFVDSGGSVQYQYRFRDGTSYLNPVVSSCG